jgi:hypothetical protein
LVVPHWLNDRLDTFLLASALPEAHVVNLLPATRARIICANINLPNFK